MRKKEVKNAHISLDGIYRLIAFVVTPIGHASFARLMTQMRREKYPEQVVASKMAS